MTQLLTRYLPDDVDEFLYKCRLCLTSSRVVDDLWPGRPDERGIAEWADDHIRKLLPSRNHEGHAMRFEAGWSREELQLIEAWLRLSVDILQDMKKPRLAARNRITADKIEEMLLVS